MARAIDFASARARLVDGLVRSGYIRDARVRSAFEAVPREAFLPTSLHRDAYADSPLPIGHGQTISAPSMIAIMLEEAGLVPGEKVLEVGTGSGYHAALLAHLVGSANVVTLERIPALAAWGRENLARCGLSVQVVTGDGSLGYPPRAPYDCVMATAGAPGIPQEWVDQLSPSGRVVAPVGRSRHEQVLLIARRRPDGGVDVREGTACAFVPLVGEKAWPL